MAAIVNDDSFAYYARNNFHCSRKDFLEGKRSWENYRRALKEYKVHWTLYQHIWFFLVGIPSMGKRFTWKYFGWIRGVIYFAVFTPIAVELASRWSGILAKLIE